MSVEEDELVIQATNKFSVLETTSVLLASTPQSVFVDINESYTRQVVRQAIQQSGFGVILGPGRGMDAVRMPANCFFQWAEYERIDWDAVLGGQHGASSYCIRKGLARKAQLAHYLHRHVCKHPTSLFQHAVPRTVVIDTWSVWDDDEGTLSNQQGLADVLTSLGNNLSHSSVNRSRRLTQCLTDAKAAMEQEEREYQRNPDAAPPTWILKGSTVNKGVGIHIVHLYEQVVDICYSESDIREWVLQKYIANPLLLNGRKFHIRAYVLAVSALKVFLCRDCLALCSGTLYRSDETSNLLAHITNTAYQDLDANFREEECVLLWSEEDIVPRLLHDGSCPTSEEAEGKIRTVLNDMEAIVAELFRAYESEFGVFAPIENCFEHYGLDFIVDDQWNVYLLEVNPGPDFKQTGNRLKSVIDRLMASTVQEILERKIYSKVSRDAGSLKLVYDKRIRGNASAISMRVT